MIQPWLWPGTPHFWIAVAIAAGAFVHVVPATIGPYLNAAALAANGIAALLMQSPQIGAK
jgi:hypothetical protein